VKVTQELETRMPPESVAGFRLVLAEARVNDAILLPERAMQRMVVKVQWMLRRVGADGIRLTKAGHLPPADVLAATTELDWGWPMRINRESSILPLQELREHLRRVGLLRLSHGTLMLTSRGRALAEAPRELWWHLARTIRTSRSPVEADATNLFLVIIARRGATEVEIYKQALALALESVGWRQRDGERLSGDAAFGVVLPKWRLFNHLGIFTKDGGDYLHWIVTPGGAAFARAALQTEL
jgi:hypothetical protein